MTPRKPSKTEPQILEMPPQKMAVVYGKGAPDKVFPEVLPALYSSVYALRSDLKKLGLPIFKVSGLRARYPDAQLAQMDKWTEIIGLPVPDYTTSLPQKAANIRVRIETWKYGTVAQILHLGPYDQEYVTVARLHRFIDESGYKIDGAHEEEYLTRPTAKVIKTIIRYPIKKK